MKGRDEDKMKLDQQGKKEIDRSFEAWMTVSTRNLQKKLLIPDLVTLGHQVPVNRELWGKLQLQLQFQRRKGRGTGAVGVFYSGYTI